MTLVLLSLTVLQPCCNLLHYALLNELELWVCKGLQEEDDE